MVKALYAGSFDPITLGHVDITERAARLFDKVVLAVFDKPLKSLAFTPEERVTLARESLAHLPNVEIMMYNGLTTHFARHVGANVLIRGLRTVVDFDKETQLSMANDHLMPEIETVCLITSQKFAFISSSLMKEIAMNGGDVRHLVPSPVLTALNKKYLAE